MAVGVLEVLDELLVTAGVLVVVAVAVVAAVIVVHLEAVAVLGPLMSYPLSNIPLLSTDSTSAFHI